MMTSVKLLMAVYCVMCFITSGFGKCGLNEFVIGTERSGREIQGKPEWNVQVVNTCNCSQSGLVLACQGFQSVEPIDPSIFQINDDVCFVNQGRPLRPRLPLRFSYAWDPPFLLTPVYSRSVC